ncbi:MAG: BrxA/BrxB family bacilliredoxin, partial [Gemmatimonadetes bacterium]|nr:BrxA/BrxB family bacilliredoxin [Gemmatimonadota bacterium]
MRYDPRLVQPMREELTRLGFLELKTPDQVDAAVREGTGTLLLVVNSVCGCAAGRARPGVALALTHRQRPDRLATVFAGMELEATDRARGYFAPYPPSSPQIGLFKAGRLVFMLERKDIERRPPEEIARDLVGAFATH